MTASATPPRNDPPHGCPPPLTLTTVDGRLQVEFRWCGDRFAQHLRLGPDQPLGHSVEGTSDQSWPASPPIQQLSLETLSADKVLLGVGAAGVGHWSISVESTCVDGVTGLKYDLACRSQTLPTWLGSTYQLSSPLEARPLANCKAGITTSGLAISVDLVSA
ncbi:MAG: hypothetical protein MI861_08615, partial [Pirellulales bacterium]|nr:hypothetical protein [Pirellulales bacterium]